MTNGKYWLPIPLQGVGAQLPSSFDRRNASLPYTSGGCSGPNNKWIPPSRSPRPNLNPPEIIVSQSRVRGTAQQLKKPELQGFYAARSASPRTPPPAAASSTHA